MSIINLDKYSNYRYNQIGGIDADRVLGDEVVPYTLTAEEVAEVLAQELEVAAYVQVIDIPQRITKKQAKRMLLQTSKLHLVEPAIAAIEDANLRAIVEIEWSDANHFERNNQYLILLASALGINATELDTLFIEGAKL